jgi:MraZ protein
VVKMTGEYRNTVDEKGRLMIPPKIREQLGSFDNLMLTKSPDGSLWLFTKEDFDALDREINYSPLAAFNKNSRILNMMVISPAREIELDKAGRLSIPQILREFAGLEPKTECVIQGVRDKVEIMSLKKYEELMIQYKSMVEDAGNELSLLRMDK